MELGKIEALLRKYEEGKTSLAEERALKEYFLNENIPAHLYNYKLLFGYTTKAKAIKYTGKETYKTKPKRKNHYALAGLAASILLIVSLFAYQNFNNPGFHDNDLGTVQDPKEAYQQAKQTLNMISNVLNNSKEDLVYLKEFNKTKNKFIKEQ